MKTWKITFADTFINELLNIPKNIGKKVTRKIKILEQDPISAQGDAKKLKYLDGNIYRVRIGNHRLFYSFDQYDVKLLSIRKRDDRTYELELPDPSIVQPLPEIAQPERFKADYLEPNKQTINSLANNPKLPENIQPKDTIKSDLPLKFDASVLEKWQIPQEYWQEIFKVKQTDDILDLPIPDRLISRILDNCFPRDLLEISQSSSYQLSQPEDLERFVDGEIEAFLLKLDPEQEKLINFGSNNGAILVKGGAGTGKSTLALYRVKKLLEFDYTSILFTTYTRALANYSEQLLEQLLGKPPAQLGIRVDTVDALARQYYVRSQGNTPQFIEEKQSLRLLQRAIAETKYPPTNDPQNKESQDKADRQFLERLGISYLLEEFEDVIEAWGIPTLDDYLQLPRRGRGMALQAKQRKIVWAVYQTWRELIDKDHCLTWSQLRLAAHRITKKLPKKPYQALVIDEAQDLSPVALRFLFNLIPGTKGVYLTADSSQSIYQKSFSWKQIHQDLQIAGRTLILKRNYRNTQQIVEACSQILEGTAAGDQECIHQKPSLYVGKIPELLLNDNLQSQLLEVKQTFFVAARKFRLPFHSGAILCPTRRLAGDIADRLKALGIKAQFVASKNIKVNSPYLKVMTLHAAKGLEFPFVAVMGLNEGTFPVVSKATPIEEINKTCDQQRRLFYVGCSRAMRFLVVCGSASSPSSFLDSLKEPYWQPKEIKLDN